MDNTPNKPNTRVINLTPHSINLYYQGKHIMSVPSVGKVRCNVITNTTGSVNIENIPIPIVKSTFGDVNGLPDPQQDTIFIVSRVVAEAVPHRNDVFYPNDLVRDENGRVIGCASLSQS